MSYPDFCTAHEDVLEWLLGMEDELEAMRPVINEGGQQQKQDLADVKLLFDENAEFMEKANREQQAVGKVGQCNDKNMFI